jgi:hypothetical protein
VKSQDVLGMYSSSNLSILVSDVTAVMPFLSQVRNVERVEGVKGRLQLYGGKPMSALSSIVLHPTVRFALWSSTFYIV